MGARARYGERDPGLIRTRSDATLQDAALGERCASRHQPCWLESTGLFARLRSLQPLEAGCWEAPRFRGYMTAASPLRLPRVAPNGCVRRFELGLLGSPSLKLLCSVLLWEKPGSSSETKTALRQNLGPNRLAPCIRRPMSMSSAALPLWVNRHPCVLLPGRWPVG